MDEAERKRKEEAVKAALAVEGGLDLARVLLLDTSVSLEPSERLRLASGVLHHLRPEPLATLAMSPARLRQLNTTRHRC